MLTTREMTDEEYQDELRAVMEGANSLTEALRGAEFGHILNILATTIQQVVSETIPQEDTDTRDKVADMLRHVADHVDMTCPHLPPGMLRTRPGRTPMALAEQPTSEVSPTKRGHLH